MTRLTQRQRGAALLTAMLIVTLVASLSAAMVWRQYRAVQIEAAERARAQGAWILQGALDWARLILREDARAKRNDPVDHLGEVWAVPLAEARLSTFLAAESGSGVAAADDGPEAFLSGLIEDAQSRYNLRNLVESGEGAAREQATLSRLCESAGIGAHNVSLIATGLRAAYLSQGDSSGAPLRPQSVAQLSWLGVDADSLKRLQPLVTLLPKPTPLNLNTAPREVIAAVLGVDLASAEAIVQRRRSQPLKNLQAAAALLPQGTALENQRASVDSSYFFVSARMRLDERVQEERALVWRDDMNIKLLQRERVNLALGRN
jgi:general secretion pathway protein K